MNRRALITMLGGAAAAWPLAARAQQAGKLPIIGYLGANTPSTESQRIAAFVQRLRELGWIDGRNIAIEYRWGEARAERLEELNVKFRYSLADETSDVMMPQSQAPAGTDRPHGPPFGTGVP